MTDLGSMKYFLGLEIEQIDDGIFMNKKQYDASFLKKFH